MATMKFLNAAGKYSDPLAYDCVIGYILQAYKTPSKIIGGFGVDLNKPAQSMKDHAILYNKDTGVRLRHFLVSFTRKESQNIHLIQKIAYHLGQVIGLTHQVVYAVHEDTGTLHIHYVFNSVALYTGRKYHGSKADHYELKKIIQNALKANGIPVCYEIPYHPSNYNPHE